MNTNMNIKKYIRRLKDLLTIIPKMRPNRIGAILYELLNFIVCGYVREKVGFEPTPPPLKDGVLTP